MVTLVESKYTVHPASHNCPIDNNLSLARLWVMWMCLAASGRLGRSNSASCVDCMVLPLGVWILIEVFATRLFILVPSQITAQTLQLHKSPKTIVSSKVT